MITHENILEYRKICKKQVFLENAPDPILGASMWRQIGDFLPVEKDLSLARGQSTANHVEYRRLPRSIRAYQTENQPPVYVHIEVRDRSQAAKELGQFCNLQETQLEPLLCLEIQVSFRIQEN